MDPAAKVKGCRKQFHITIDCKHHHSATGGHPFPCNICLCTGTGQAPKIIYSTGFGLVFLGFGFLCQQLSEATRVIVQPTPPLVCSQRHRGQAAGGGRGAAPFGSCLHLDWIKHNTEPHPLAIKSLFQRCPNDKGARSHWFSVSKANITKSLKTWTDMQKEIEGVQCCEIRASKSLQPLCRLGCRA